MHSLKDHIHRTNAALELALFFREILKASFRATVKPGITGKSHKMKAGMLPKSKATEVSALATDLNFNKEQHRELGSENRVADDDFLF